MKKRLLATLLSLLLILSLTPITAFAQAQEVTDTNGVTLNYEVTSSPQNGEYYVEGEEVDIIISVTNNSSETISEYSLDNGYTAIYNKLLPGNSSEKLSCSYVVSAEDAEAGTKSFDIGCTYKLNGQTDNNTLSKTLTVSTGPGDRNPGIQRSDYAGSRFRGPYGNDFASLQRRGGSWRRGSGALYRRGLYIVRGAPESRSERGRFPADGVLQRRQQRLRHIS